MFAKRPRRLPAALILVALLVGCGGDRPRTAVVQGKVTFRGKPVPNGTILFHPASGPTAQGEIRPDGTYRLTTFREGDGAVLGKHKVVIVAMQDTGGRLPEERTPLPPPIIPEKYTSIGTSDLRADVKEGENTLDFDLQDDGKKR